MKNRPFPGVNSVKTDPSQEYMCRMTPFQDHRSRVTSHKNCPPLPHIQAYIGLPYLMPYYSLVFRNGTGLDLYLQQTLGVVCIYQFTASQANGETLRAVHGSSRENNHREVHKKLPEAEKMNKKQIQSLIRMQRTDRRGSASYVTESNWAYSKEV